MAQTILSVYVGDQLYKWVFFVISLSLDVGPDVPSHSYVIRIVGTFLGLITGILIWYCGRCIRTARIRGVVKPRV